MTEVYSISKVGLQTILIMVGIIAVLVIGIEVLNQNEKSHVEDILKKSREENTLWVKNFQTLTDCKDMILQLTEKRFYDDTFKQQAWYHYKELC